MLEPAILKPYLLDDDPWVRSAVARYFDEGWLQDEELVPLILDACDQFGYRKNVSSLACCRHLPLTAPAFERVLRLLAKRIHETLGYLTPEQYETVNAPASKVAYRTQPGVRQWWATANQQNTRSVVLPLCAQDDTQPH